MAEQSAEAHGQGKECDYVTEEQEDLFMAAWLLGIQQSR